jgi:hypothetical protein
MKKIRICFFIFVTNFSAFCLTSCERPPEKEISSDNKIDVEMRPFETTASEIAWEYSNDAMTADEKFKDKTFNLTGVIVGVSKNSTNEPYVTLKGGLNPKKEPQFAFIVKDREKASGLITGQSVKLQCKGLGVLDGAPAAGACKLLE